MRSAGVAGPGCMVRAVVMRGLWGAGLVDGVWLAEGEGVDDCVENGSAVGDHCVDALHAAEGGVEGAGAGVVEGLSGYDVGLFADDAGAVDFGYDAFGVGDFPVSADESDGLVGVVCDLDLIEKIPHTSLW